MKPRHIAHELAVIAIVCVIGIFLFPATAGPYSAVHGPVTALEAMRASIRIACAMIMAAFVLDLLLHFSAFSMYLFRNSVDICLCSPGPSSALRC